MKRREMLKVLTLGLVSGPAALEMFAELTHKRTLFPGADFGWAKVTPVWGGVDATMRIYTNFADWRGLLPEETHRPHT